MQQIYQRDYRNGNDEGSCNDDKCSIEARGDSFAMRNEKCPSVRDIDTTHDGTTEHHILPKQQISIMKSEQSHASDELGVFN
jgi:hypothetical protein